MPIRYLKPGVRDSEAIDALAPLAETLFYRLLVTVDDFGRYDARPAMVKAQCFPIKESVTIRKCDELLQELAQHGLVHLYEVEGKPYLQMLKWDNVPRAKESKFPTPPSTCMQMHADAQHPHTNAPLTETETETQTESPPTPRKREGVRFEEFWKAWPKSERKQDKAKCLDHWKRNGLDELTDPILQDIDTKRKTQKWAEGYIEAPLVYLRGKRWQDGVTPAPATPGGTSEVLDWRSSQSGIRAKGVEVGVGDWNEAAFQTGQGEHFPAYRARVEAKVRDLERRDVDPVGQRRIADLIGHALGSAA